MFLRNNVLNVNLNDAEFATNAWNAHDWDVR
jgi:hypothetical protein